MHRLLLVPTGCWCWYVYLKHIQRPAKLHNNFVCLRATALWAAHHEGMLSPHASCGGMVATQSKDFETH